MFKQAPVAGREAVLLSGGTISLRPDPAGHYVAEATIFPALPLESGSSGNLRGTAIGCAGAQLHVALTVPIEVRVA